VFRLYTWLISLDFKVSKALDGDSPPSYLAASCGSDHTLLTRRLVRGMVAKTTYALDVDRGCELSMVGAIVECKPSCSRRR
jgi:tRNA A22 N-methylase